ncbi:MAG: FeoB-associated Cys-rich membrane protein [Verrucomicrobiales bacterium]|nr:FeoB-associated Cys-rich membrane protein [Verrucomicrobiales bacterium]
MNPNALSDWQTWAAITAVVVTMVLFIRGARKKKKSGGCDSCGPVGCGSDPE